MLTVMPTHPIHFEPQASQASSQFVVHALDIEGADYAEGLPPAAKDNNNARPAILDEAVLDMLDDQGVSQELLEDWTVREMQSFKPVPSGVQVALLPPQVRATTLRFISHVAQLAGLQQKSFFEAATLLDIYHVKTIDPDEILPTIETLPATCAALVAILRKFDCVTAQVSGVSFVSHASSFAQYLSSELGYSSIDPHVTEEMINDQEKIVLKALEWRINVPNAESWMNLFSGRFNIITRNTVAPTLCWVWQTGLCGARMVTMQQAAGSDLPPRVLAAGLLAFGLVSGGLLPKEALQPRQMTPSQWSMLCDELQPNGQQMQRVAATDAQICSLLSIYSAAVGITIEEIKEYTCLAALALRDALKAQGAQHPMGAAAYQTTI
jgi:hypothetical protein